MASSTTSVAIPSRKNFSRSNRFLPLNQLQLCIRLATGCVEMVRWPHLDTLSGGIGRIQVIVSNRSSLSCRRRGNRGPEAMEMQHHAIDAVDFIRLPRGGQLKFGVLIASQNQ